jgi:hypothetical protein
VLRFKRGFYQKRVIALVDSVPDSGVTFALRGSDRVENGMETVMRESMRRAAGPRLVSFFRVPLVCEAAAHIGCGTRARPILADVEGQPGVRGAWLNREGTILAIAWPDGVADSEERAKRSQEA